MVACSLALVVSNLSLILSQLPHSTVKGKLVSSVSHVLDLKEGAQVTLNLGPTAMAGHVGMPALKRSFVHAWVSCPSLWLGG